MLNQKKITTYLSFIAGIILSGISLMILVAMISNAVYPPDPNLPMEGGFMQIAGGIFLSALFLLLGIPGILSQFSKNELKRRKMLKVNGFILLIFILIFPLSLPMPYGMILPILFLGCAGLWITIFTLNEKNFSP